MDEIYTQLVKVFQKKKLSSKEILLCYVNLGYTLGASIEGIKDPISQEQLELRYATNPTIGISLMMQSILMSTWANDIGKTVEDIKNENK